MKKQHTSVRVLTTHGKPGFVAPDGRILPLVSGGDGPLTEAEEQAQAEQQAAAEAQARAEAEAQQQQQGIQIPAEKPTPAEQAAPDLLFTREDIEKARKEEKDKLYGRLQSLEERLAETEKERQERLAAEEEARKAAEAEAKKAAEEEMSARELIEAKDREWSEKIARLEAEREEERRVFEMERQFQQVEQYRLQALAQNEDMIMPELRDLVRGNTPEEIDSAVALAVEKTDRILQQVQAQNQAMRQGQRAASVTAPAAGPMENETNYQTLTAEDIRNMDMETYRQKREQILGALGSQNQSQGLYG